jgi:hypothetical protein
MMVKNPVTGLTEVYHVSAQHKWSLVSHYKRLLIVRIKPVSIRRLKYIQRTRDSAILAVYIDKDFKHDEVEVIIGMGGSKCVTRPGM